MRTREETARRLHAREGGLRGPRPAHTRVWDSSSRAGDGERLLFKPACLWDLLQPSWQTNPLTLDEEHAGPSRLWGQMGLVPRYPARSQGEVGRLVGEEAWGYEKPWKVRAGGQDLAFQAQPLRGRGADRTAKGSSEHTCAPTNQTTQGRRACSRKDTSNQN